MIDIVDRVKKFIIDKGLICKNDVVGCALSGGADSVFMSFILNLISKDMGFKIICIHVNHMLRGKDSYEDECFSREFCEKYGIEFYSYNVNVRDYSKKNKISIEMAGRELRYKVFDELRVQGIINRCAIAHHSDDDVETILMRIFKGTGIDGIEGIKESRDNFYIRPILFLRRESEIEKFLNENSINFKIDKSNFSEDYLRNKIRNSIIPEINQKLSMDINKSILNLKEISKCDNEFFDDLVKNYLHEYVEISNQNMYIDKRCFELHNAILFRLIRRSIFLFNGDIKDLSLKHIKYICDIVHKKNGKFIQIKKNLFCFNQQNFLKFSKDIILEEDNRNFYFELVGEDEILEFKMRNLNKLNKELDFFGKKINIVIKLEPNIENCKLKDVSNSYKYFSLDDVKERIYIRNRNYGDTFIPFGMKSNKKLKEILINEKIINKNKVPLICFDNEIVWIYNIRNSDKYKVEDNSKTIIKIKLEYL